MNTLSASDIREIFEQLDVIKNFTRAMCRTIRVPTVNEAVDADLAVECVARKLREVAIVDVEVEAE
jgi:hypothetical protein